MTTYEISYQEYDVTREPRLRSRRVVVGQQEARNGIEAIRALLRDRFDGDSDLTAELENAWTGGSRKRLVLAGVTFEANIVR